VKVLAFDIASRTGVCFGEAGQKPRAWAVSLGEGDDRYAKAIRMCGAYVDRFQPDLVVIEAPVGGRDASALLIGLIACVKGEAMRRGVQTVEYFPSTVRKHFMGKALTAKDFPGKTHGAAKKAIKGAVMARCIALGWEVRDGDAADAAALWDYACAVHSRAHQMTSVGGLFHA
jgi:Holliday junction resolvasome RuvABC endonuclease subunit